MTFAGISAEFHQNLTGLLPELPQNFAGISPEYSILGISPEFRIGAPTKRG